MENAGRLVGKYPKMGLTEALLRGAQPPRTATVLKDLQNGRTAGSLEEVQIKAAQIIVERLLVEVCTGSITRESAVALLTNFADRCPPLQRTLAQVEAAGAVKH